MKNKHIVVGVGQIGAQLAQMLLDEGHRVQVIRRSNKPVEGFPKLDVIAGDATDSTWLAAQLMDAEVVYGCANPADYHRWPTQLPPLYRGVWQAAQKAGIRLVMLDNLYAYGRVSELGFDENTPQNPCSIKGELRATLRAEMMEAAALGELDVQVGLASDFFGPGTTENSFYGESFVKKLGDGGKAMVVGDPTLARAYSYAPDVARGLLTLGTRPPTTSGVWHLPVSFTGTTKQFVASFANALGQPAQMFVLKDWMLRLAGVFVPPIGAVREMVYQWEQPYVPSDAKFVHAFEVGPTPFDTAVRQTLKALAADHERSSQVCPA